MKESLDWFEEGTGLYDEGNYRGAITAFDRAIALDPSLVDAWNNRGIALIQMGRDQEALRSIERALTLNPRHENALKTRELLLELLGDRVDAGGKQGSGHYDPVSPREIPDTDSVQLRTGPVNPAMQRSVPPPPARADPPSPDSSPRGQVPSKPAPANPVPQRAVAPDEKKMVRYPILAVIFSILFLGWGQWYCGKTWGGVKLVGALVGSSFFLVILAALTRNPALLLGIFLVAVVIWLYGIYDSYNLAERINRGEEQFSGKSVLFWFPVVMVVFSFFILPAVIAAFVFGMAGNIQHVRVVAATAQQPDANHIEVMFQGGQDAGMVRQMIVTVTDSAGSSQTKTIGSPEQATPLEVGSSLTFTGAFSGRDHLVANVKFTDGTDELILDTWI
jgi:hypothetical protein